MPINCIPIIILGIFITYLKQVAAIITYLCYRQIYKLPYSLRNLAILCFSNSIAKVDLFLSHRYRYTSVHPVHICLQWFIHYRTICDCLILRTHKINVNKHKKTKVNEIDLLWKKIMLIDMETIAQHTSTRLVN